VDASPLGVPGVRHAANDGGEHERRDEGEEHEVDEALQSVVAQSRDGLDKVLREGEAPPLLCGQISARVKKTPGQSRKTRRKKNICRSCFFVVVLFACGFKMHLL